MKRRRAFTALVVPVLAAFGAHGAAMAADWDVATLMRGLAQQRGGKVTFVEKKYIAILDRPVESTGELVYQPPARLEKRTLTPLVEVLVLDRDLLVLERGKQRITMRLQQYPEIGAIVDSIRGTLAGDLAALERQYRVVLEGTHERWLLTLLPSDTQIAALVQRIEISGVRNELRRIEMLQADGDRSVMNIQAPAPR